MTKKTKKIDGKAAEGDKLFTPPKSNTFAGKRNVKSIDELLGRNDSPYAVESYEDYEKRIKTLTTSDLERHATQMGVFPTSNKSILMKRLLNEFRKVSGGYFNVVQDGDNSGGKDPEALRRVLEKGKN